jgi:hypothetical protein
MARTTGNPLGKLGLVLAAPWIALYGVVTALVLLVRAIRYVVRLPVALRPTLTCPLGHPQPATAFWRCGCGAAFAGYAFGRCPICGQTAGYVDPCPSCGLSVKNPLGRP